MVTCFFLSGIVLIMVRNPETHVLKFNLRRLLIYAVLCSAAVIFLLYYFFISPEYRVNQYTGAT